MNKGKIHYRQKIGIPQKL